ncbi:hypothetical protein [Thioflexithrix psekupsensis]|uniref:Double-GTPase 1 domain-containing protein n=1 Tax=Thioflexithrix psekupsensis TaxID=1570016 RepID=A0A251X3G8_9GAMM|nr:hypothetical protein [Thioflexithrix psekupsensis]OUD11712.1 hypothetical protein TPSD3_16810 [Thioflexithrix psekupsensis]
MEKTKRKIYKIGLFGYSGSGKSCILTALGMPRRPSPSGLSALWLPMGELDNSEHSNRLKAGKQWLEAAITQITKGEVPPPTAISDQFIFEYEFGTPEGRTFRIDIFDYSGELLNTRVDESQIAQNLRKIFSELDGILILAEAPNRQANSRDNEQTYHNIYGLSRVFAQVRSHKQEGANFDMPVAMVVNKWDRWSPDFKPLPSCPVPSFRSSNPNIDLTRPVKIPKNRFNFPVQKKLLDEFIGDQKNPAHKGLYDTLCNVMSQGNFELFPNQCFWQQSSGKYR